MARGPSLSADDKVHLGEKLRKECERNWTTYGYKKTNIKELCAGLGIGIGTFYMLYPTKEDLFFATLEEIQSNLNKEFFDKVLFNEPTKVGFAKSIKGLYKEYYRKPFLYGTNSDDFISFSSKLPQEKLVKLKFDNVEFFQKAIDTANLTLKVPKDIAFGVFSALLSTISVKDTLSSICDNFILFDFMLDNLINEIFEERRCYAMDRYEYKTVVTDLSEKNVW